MYECTDKLILETILQDKFSYFKAEERGVAVATATDDNAEIRNLDVRLFKKSTCWYTGIAIVMRIMHLKQYPVPALYSQVRKKNGEYPPGMFQEFYVRLVHSEDRLLS